MRHIYVVFLFLFVFAIGSAQAAGNCGTIYVKPPASWSAVYYNLGGSFYSFTDEGNGWFSRELTYPNDNSSFWLSSANTYYPTQSITKSVWDYDGQSQASFSCADMGPEKTLYITEDPTNLGSTYFGSAPPDAKYVFVLNPWGHTVPRIMKNNNEYKMNEDPTNCGWFYKAFDPDDLGNAIFKQALGSVTFGATGLNSLDSIDLSAVLASSDTVWIAMGADGIPIYSDSDPGIIGKCSDRKRTIFFVNPWEGTVPKMQTQSGTFDLTPHPDEDICGWYYKTFTSESIDSAIFIQAKGSDTFGADGLGSSNYFKWDTAFTNSDTVYVYADKFGIDISPKLVSKYPVGVLGQCRNDKLAVMIFDQARDMIDFVGPSWTTKALNCGASYTGMVKTQLGTDGLPDKTDNLACWTNNSTDIKDWFIPKSETTSSGVNYTNASCYDLPLEMDADGFWVSDFDETSPLGGLFPNEAGEYIDVDGNIFVDKTSPFYTSYPNNAGDNRNYLFNMHINATFKYVLGQTFDFRGDDDVWVYINDQLVVDLGGTHEPLEGAVNLDNLGLVEDSVYSFHIFYSERSPTGANFKMKTSINLKTERTLLYDIVRESGDVRYEIKQIVKQSKLHCDFTPSVTDPIPAKAIYTLQGVNIITPEKLETGISYEGITISDDNSTITVDTATIAAKRTLSPGTYTLTFTLEKDLSLSGSVRFIIPLVEGDPPQIQFVDSKTHEKIDPTTTKIGTYAYQIYPVSIGYFDEGANECGEFCDMVVDLKTETGIVFLDADGNEITSVKLNGGYADFQMYTTIDAINGAFGAGNATVPAILWSDIISHLPEIQFVDSNFAAIDPDTVNIMEKAFFHYPVRVETFFDYGHLDNYDSVLQLTANDSIFFTDKDGNRITEVKMDSGFAYFEIYTTESLAEAAFVVSGPTLLDKLIWPGINSKKPEIRFVDSLLLPIDQDTVRLGEYAYVPYEVKVEAFFPDGHYNDFTGVLKLDTQDSLVFTDVFGNIITEILMDSGWATFMVYSTEPIEDGEFVVSGKSAENKLIWGDIDLEKPPVPVPIFGGIFDTDGDGIADSLAVEYASDVEEELPDSFAYRVSLDTNSALIKMRSVSDEYVNGKKLELKSDGFYDEVSTDLTGTSITWFTSKGKLFDLPIKLEDYMGPVITSSEIMIGEDGLDTLFVSFSEAIEDDSLSDEQEKKMLYFNYFLDGNRQEGIFDAAHIRWSSNGKIAIVYFISGEGPSAGDSVKIRVVDEEEDFATLYDKKANPAHPDNGYVMITGRQRGSVEKLGYSEYNPKEYIKGDDFEVEEFLEDIAEVTMVKGVKISGVNLGQSSTNGFIDKFETGSNAGSASSDDKKKIFTTFIMAVDLDGTAKQLLEETGYLGYLVRTDLAGLVLNSADSTIEAKDVDLYYKAWYFTATGGFVAYDKGYVNCTDEALFDGDCTSNNANLFFGWNYRSQDGRLVGSGAYPTIFQYIIKVRNKVVDKKISRATWGVSRKE